MSSREERIRREREKRRRKHRLKLRIRQIVAILIAVAVVAIAITLIVLLIKAIIPGKSKEAGSTNSTVNLYEGESDTGESTTTTEPTDTDGTDEESESLEPNESQEGQNSSNDTANASITISAVGDCTLGTDENADTDTSFAAVYSQQGYPGYFFENVKSILAADDLTIANLEGTITTETTREDKTFAFRGDPEYTSILTEGSVEAVNLANNHSKDYGEASYEDTQKYVKEAGITSFGYDKTAIMDVKGIKVGLVGIYVLADGLERMTQLKENIQMVKSQGANLVIVSFHWGIEKEYVPNEEQVTLGHAAVDAGADLVLGHHPHVLEGIEEYNGKNIVYSLGNFCFGGNKNPSDKETMIFQQTFTFKDGQLVADNQKNIIPCTLSSTSSYNDYQPTPAEGERAQEILTHIQNYSDELL